MIPAWYWVAVLLPQLVVTGVIVRGLVLKRRLERSLGDRSLEEVEEDLKGVPCRRTVRVTFRPELIWCCPPFVLAGLTGWLMLTMLYEFEMLGVIRTLPRDSLQGLLAAVLVLAYSTCAVATLPGTPERALKAHVAVVLGSVLGVAAVLGLLPSYCGWLAPVVMLVGLLAVMRYGERVEVRGESAWDEVVETAQRYPVPRPKEGEGAAERCVLRLTACRVAIERGLPG